MNSGRCSIEFIHEAGQLQKKLNKMLMNLQYALGRRKQALNGKRSLHNPNTQTALALTDADGKVI